MAEFITGNDHLDNGNGNNKMSDKDKKTVAISIVAVFVLLLIGGAVAFFIMNGGGAADQAIAEDNEIVKEKKQELTEVYEKSGIKLANDDFVVEEDVEKEVDDPDRYIVTTVVWKQEELEQMKVESINYIIEDRGVSELPSPSSDESGKKEKPEKDDNSSSSSTEQSEEPDEEDVNSTVNNFEEQILTNVNHKLGDIKSYINRSLEETDQTYFFNVLFDGLLQTMRTGWPHSPSDEYNSSGISYEEAFYSMLGYFFYHDICEDTNPVTGNQTTWDSSYLGTYQANTFYSTVINSYYDLTFDSIEAIYEDQVVFNIDGEEIYSYYTIYSNGHYLILGYDFELLDIL